MRLRRLHNGFSLVEVAIALGIFVFALVSLVGLMPVALSTARESLDMTVAAQLAAGEAARLEQLPYSALPDIPIVSWFDAVGAPLNSRDGAIYRLDTILSSSESDSLKRVIIAVSRSPNPEIRKSFCYLIFKRK